MVVKVYYSEISGSKEVKKRQQRVMMILDSKLIPYEAIDITEPGKESAKDFMLSNAKPRGDSKIILSPQIFSDDLYCGDYDDFDLANENDVLEKFLHSPKIERNVPAAAPVSTTNGSVGSREPSVETTAPPTNGTNDNENNEAEQQQQQQEEPTQSEAPTDTASSEPAAVDSTTEETGIDQEEEQVDE